MICLKPSLPALPRESLTTHAPSGTYTGFAHADVLVYKGIYYGRAERFMAPKMSCDRQAKERVYACPQDGSPWLDRAEDCLTLNIYAPKSAYKKPVLVYIHGGSFMRGSNNDYQTQGQRLAKNVDVVVVTVNYRLGVFGFMDFSELDDVFCKNPGVADLKLALTFIKKNIGAFAGDEDNITLMGESAGGTLAALLSTLISDDTFHKVILSSPVPTAFISKKESRARSRAFLKSSAIADAATIKDIPASQLVEASSAFCESSGLGFSAFSPAVDGCIIKETPLSKQLKGEVKRRPTWIGVTADEMSFLRWPRMAERWRIKDVLPRQLEREGTDFIQELEALYKRLFGEERYLVELYSDLIIRVSTAWYAEAAADHQEVWLYRFSHAGPLVSRTPLKAFHTIDLYYLFDTLPLPMRISINRQMVQMIQSDLKQFLYAGRLPWEKATPERLSAKHYALPPHFNDMLSSEVLAFWRQSEHYRQRMEASFGDANEVHTTLSEKA